MLSKRLNDFVSRIIRRAIASNSLIDDKIVPQIQVSYQGGAANCEVLAPYGMGYNPPVGSFSLMYNIAGNSDDRAAIFYHPKTRWKGLNPTETQFGNPDKKTYIKFNENGSIDIIGKADINIKTENGQINLESESGSPINLGSGGNALARLGDMVEITIPSGSSAGTYQGTIISGGNNTST